jgi:hypothetical protein
MARLGLSHVRGMSMAQELQARKEENERYSRSARSGFLVQSTPILENLDEEAQRLA